MPPGPPPFGSYSWAYIEAAKMLASEVRKKYPTLDIMGAPLVFLYRHAMETALKDIFGLLSKSKMTQPVCTPESFQHNLEKLLDAVEAEVETHIAGHRTSRELDEIPLSLTAPFRLPEETRKTLAAFNDKQYPERYPAEKWRQEYDFDKFESECDSALYDLDWTDKLIKEVAFLKSGKPRFEPEEWEQGDAESP